MATLKEIAYDCRKASYLIEKKQFGNISIKERLQLKYHLTGCSVCRLYQQQSVYISDILHQAFADFNSTGLSISDSDITNMQKEINLRLGSM